jgi:hypothetical protein
MGAIIPASTSAKKCNLSWLNQAQKKRKKEKK